MNVDMNNRVKRNNCKLFKKQIERKDVNIKVSNQVNLKILSTCLNIKCRSLSMPILGLGSKYLSAEYPSQVEVNTIAHSQ